MSDLKGRAGRTMRFRSNNTESADSEEQSYPTDHSPQAKRKSGWWARFQELRWRVPNKFPHGLFGIAAFITGGLAFIRVCFMGKPPPRSIYLPFVFFTVCNAGSGFMLAMGGWRGVQFRVICVFLIGMCWFSLRFDGIFGYGVLVRTMDALAMLSLTGIHAMIFFMQYHRNYMKTVSVSAMGLSFVIFLLVTTFLGIPLQFTIGGEEWIECVLKEWPAQRICYADFVFTPVVWWVALGTFGLTLREKGLISPFLQFVVFGLGGVFVLVVCTIAQDTWYPVVTTSRLYNPCPLPPEGTWSRWFSDTINASYVTKYVFGVPLPDEHFR